MRAFYFYAAEAVAKAWDLCLFHTSEVSNEEETEAITSSADTEALEHVAQVKRVKLTIMIEDPRDVERRRLLGLDDENAPTRDDLADALEEVALARLSVVKQESQGRHVLCQEEEQAAGKAVFDRRIHAHHSFIILGHLENKLYLM